MGLAHLYFRKVSVFVFPEFPCRFHFRRKLLTRFLFRFYLKYSVSVPFSHNTAFVSFFRSLFPFIRKRTESFLAVFNPTFDAVRDHVKLTKLANRIFYCLAMGKKFHGT
jgi:hypothetical protein